MLSCNVSQFSLFLAAILCELGIVEMGISEDVVWVEQRCEQLSATLTNQIGEILPMADKQCLLGRYLHIENNRVCLRISTHSAEWWKIPDNSLINPLYIYGVMVAKPTGNLANTLKVIAKFEELMHANVIALDIPGHTLLVKSEIIPSNQEARNKWKREATLYFAFKAAGEFNHEEDTLHIKDKDTGKLLQQVVFDRATQVIIDRTEQPN